MGSVTNSVRSVFMAQWLYEMLKNDHKNVKKLLLVTLENEDPSKFHAIQKELEPHILGEEKYFYPAIKKKATFMVLEGYEEHELAKKLLYELDKLDENDERWMPKMKVLQEIIELHIGEEEGEMFPKAREILNEEQEQKIMEQIKKEKSKYTKSYI